MVSYLTPAGAPLNQNPGFRSYTFDRKTFNILDYKQYYLDLNKANGARKMEVRRALRSKWRAAHSDTDMPSSQPRSPIN